MESLRRETIGNGPGAVIAALESGALFPKEVVVAAGRIVEFQGPLFPEEELALRNASLKRRLEFAAGRHLARKAMTSFGVDNCAISMRADRTPVWPDGIAGSISHSGEVCAAVVTKKGDLMSIGLDVEFAPIEGEHLERYVSTSDELVLASEILKDDGLALRIIFSAKEAFFKAWYPIFGSFLDFHDVRVRFGSPAIDVACRRSLHFDLPNWRKPLQYRFDGRWEAVGGGVLAGVVCYKQ
ncbi:MAG: 4'-phosphopantetheinyl transferase family protein [Asticcacaulis sp.]|uniref:4'-phosphopantetheinyl transferase family protein n=1 Tax=Asticcacaulis sp. TaxID=1872648 RepID=UPI003F7C3BB5